MPQYSVLVPILYSPYINDAPAAPRIHLALFADGTYTSIYATEKHELRDFNKLQRGLTAVRSWCHRWNTKINERKTQMIYFSRRCGIPKDDLQLNGGKIPFVNCVKYLGFAFDRKMTWKLHIEDLYIVQNFNSASLTVKIMTALWAVKAEIPHNL